MKKGSIILALAIAVLLGAGVVGAGASGTDTAKKRCHFVKKKVHGKIKRVRVCTKPKPKPAPKVMNVSLSLDSTHSTSVVVGKAERNGHGARSRRFRPHAVRPGRRACKRYDDLADTHRFAGWVAQGVEARRGCPVRA